MKGDCFLIDRSFRAYPHILDVHISVQIPASISFDLIGAMSISYRFSELAFTSGNCFIVHHLLSC